MTGPERFKDWAVLELFGHRKYAGLVQEVELAGAPMLRIDVPSDPPVTQFYGAKSVYCMTPVDEDTARRYAAGNRPEPISRWELRTPALPPAPTDAEVLADGDEVCPVCRSEPCEDACPGETDDSNDLLVHCERCGERIPEGEAVHERGTPDDGGELADVCGECAVEIDADVGTPP